VIHDAATDDLLAGRSIGVRNGLQQAWQILSSDYGLLPDLALDAVLARADRGELATATPRLLELMVGEQLSVVSAVDVMVRLGGGSWSDGQRRAIEDVLDAWWLETLMASPGEHRQPLTPDTVLGILVSYGAPMVRWFEPWLAELDGPGAAHLATMVIDGVDGPAWEGKADEASQVLGWARSDTVLNGLVLIGGTHLDDGVLGEVLDRLV
jgi:hypothetical protein